MPPHRLFCFCRRIGFLLDRAGKSGYTVFVRIYGKEGKAVLDLAIIGGGPAGLAAGLYAVRGGANVCLYEEMFAGGQIVKL